MAVKRKMEVLFEDGSKEIYEQALLGPHLAKFQNDCALGLFEKLRQGKYTPDFYDHREHPAREPGARATHILRLWNG